MKQLFRISFLFIFFLCVSPRWSTLLATACPTSPSSGVTYTVTADCVFTPAIPGVDAGTGTTNTAILDVTSGALLNIDREIGTGSVKMTSGTLSIATQGTSKISLGKALYWTDADGDGYATDPAAAAVTFTAGTGKIRRSALASPTNWDCNDSGASTYANAVCYTDTDGDGQYSMTRTASICGAGICPGASANPGTDCNDNSSSVWIAHAQCYKDADADTYTGGLAANSTCLNTASCATATAASASTDGSTVTAYTAGRLLNSASGTTDCCDTDANAKPGQTVYSTTARVGCGGYDYNCDSIETHSVTSGASGCGTCSNNTGTQSCSWSGGTGGWIAGDPGCGNTATTQQPGMCNEMTSYPNCSITGCATFSTTQSCL